MALSLCSRAMPLLSYLLLLGVHVPASHGSSAQFPPAYNASICSETSICGSVNISYPFYLTTAIRESTDYKSSYSCGYTDLKIFCKGEGGPKATPVIRLGGDGYTVLNISYDSHTITLADSDMLGNASCPAVRHDVSFDDVWLHNTSSNANLTFVFDCGSDIPPGYSRYRIDCDGFKSPFGGAASFVFTSDDDDKGEEHELAAIYCKEVISVLVNSSFLVMSSNDRTMFTSGGYGDVLKHGFELGWNYTTRDHCYLQCEQSGGRCAYSQDREFLSCLCSDGKVGNPNCAVYANNASASTSGHANKRTIIETVAITSSLLFLCLLVLAFFWTCKYGWIPFKPNSEPRIESFLQKNRNLHPKRYTYAEVKRMTKSFAVKLGQGGFGAVYRGSLSDGRQVAVKLLKATKGDGEEFMNEVASISRTSHVNVVTLLGFCLQGSKRALIYEYMPNGSLERYAFSSNMNTEDSLSWEKLFDIAIGIARGLEYLHRGCNTRIVHFDIKPHNILLDQDFCPKISDFGLAKLCLNKESVISIGGARGTIGYIAPEVYSKQFGTVSSKSDVYSYGMMVLEMVGARDKNRNADSEGSSQYFPQWIYEHLDDYCISASEINGEITELVRKMIVVSLWCVQVLPTDRPTMTRVVEMLEGSTSNLELPQKMLLGC
ncbi:hypothetical protein BS78_03G238100 [Paspalum vaginatum]|nr:hypothetical protein BS78_03G238100 [Paspalum vaginatum]